MSVISSNLCIALKNKLNEFSSGKGLEAHVFKVGWYNSLVDEHFKLPYCDDTLSFVIISKPCMFEKTFIPHLLKRWKEAKSLMKQSATSTEINFIDNILQSIGVNKADAIPPDIYDSVNLFFQQLIRDPIDECMQDAFIEIMQCLPYKNVDKMHDFEIDPFRKPKILVQTAGYVASAVAMYRMEDLDKYPSTASISEPSSNDCKHNDKDQVNTDSESTNKKYFPVCLHPEFGGWFSLRGVLILKDVTCPELEKPHQRSILTAREQVIDVLERFNNGLFDWTFRDVIPVQSRYSDLQCQYFKTMPKDRKSIILKIICNSENIC